MSPTPLIPGYVLQRQIGEGGSAVVYAAEQTVPVQRTVAIKVARAAAAGGVADDPLRVEQRALAQLAHDNVARVLDGGTTADGRAFLVMEYVDGEPIDAWCASRKLDVRARVRLLCAACRGVQHAHQKGLLHCDLKPANILVGEVDGRTDVKIVDFGLARSRGRASDAETGRTPAFLSPEELLASRSAADARADVFGLGLVLFGLLTGRHPWLDDGDCDLREYRRRLEQVALPAPSRLAPALELDADLDAVVARALAIDPESRYESPEQLAGELERWCAGLPVEARQPRPIERLSRFARRHRVGVGAAIVIAMALIGASVATWSSFREAETALARQRQARNQAEERERDARAGLQRFEALAGFVRLRRARRAAEALHPIWPQQLPALRQWMREHAEPLLALAAGLQPQAIAAGDDDSARFLRTHLTELVGLLQEFTSGDVPRVRAWIAWAERVAEETLEGRRELWRRTLTDVRRSGKYGELALAPQIGLVPLGADPDSGLFEFAHARSGRIPERGIGGRLDCDDSTGIVFVLIPGGTARIGAETDPARPRFDASASSTEAPVHDVALEAFFLAKHEMSQGQWLRLTGDNPAWFRAGRSVLDARYDLAYPVETVDWDTCVHELRRWGLSLPTEVQWEYGCRAGTDTPWWTGADRETLVGSVNLADGSSMVDGVRLPPPADWPRFRDGFSGTAPVHTLRANGFGLHHVHGNVAEWCADALVDYDRQAAPGDGLRSEEGTQRVQRGGHWNSSTVAAVRSSARAVGTAGQASQTCGVRPARRILP